MVLADFLTETRKRWIKMKVLGAYFTTLHQCGLVDFNDCYMMMSTGTYDITSSPRHGAVKMFKGDRYRKGNKANRVSPAPARAVSYNGTVDARSEIDLQRFCSCRTSMPPADSADASDGDGSCGSSTRGSDSGYGYDNRGSECGFDGTRGSDSAYDSARSSPSRPNAPEPLRRITTVCYFNTNDSEDSSSIRTEYTVLDYEDTLDLDESTQNVINEGIELVSSL